MRFTTRQTANGALVVVASWHSPCVLDVAEQVHRGLPLVKSAAGHTWCSVREMAGQSAGSGPAGAEQSSAIFQTLAESAVRPNLACVRILLTFGCGRDLGAGWRRHTKKCRRHPAGQTHAGLARGPGAPSHFRSESKVSRSLPFAKFLRHHFKSVSAVDSINRKIAIQGEDAPRVACFSGGNQRGIGEVHRSVKVLFISDLIR